MKTRLRHRYYLFNPITGRARRLTKLPKNQIIDKYIHEVIEPIGDFRLHQFQMNDTSDYVYWLTSLVKSCKSGLIAKEMLKMKRDKFNIDELLAQAKIGGNQ